MTILRTAVQQTTIDDEKIKLKADAAPKEYFDKLCQINLATLCRPSLGQQGEEETKLVHQQFRFSLEYLMRQGVLNSKGTPKSSLPQCNGSPGTDFA